MEGCAPSRPLGSLSNSIRFNTPYYLVIWVKKDEDEEADDDEDLFYDDLP